MTTRRELMASTITLAEKTVFDSPAMLARHGYDKEKFALIVREAIITNPDIINCTQTSLAQAVRRCCRDGIVPDGDMGAIVPFGTEAVAMPMVNGLKKLAFDCLGAEIRSGAIFDGQEVSVIQGVGIEPQISIVATGTSFFTDGQDAPVVGAYCWLKLPNEDTARLTLFTKRDIDRVRAISRAKNGPWKIWPDRMSEKSVVKRGISLIKYMKDTRTEALFNMVESDDEAEFGPVTIDGTATEVKEPKKVGKGKSPPKPAADKPAAKEPAQEKPKPAAAPKPEKQAQESNELPDVEEDDGGHADDPGPGDDDWTEEETQGSFLPEEDDTSL